jgi:hypothetical protein
MRSYIVVVKDRFHTGNGARQHSLSVMHEPIVPHSDLHLKIFSKEGCMNLDCGLPADKKEGFFWGWHLRICWESNDEFPAFGMIHLLNNIKPQ